jgi:hypothetical protein
MLNRTNLTISKDDLESAINHLPENDFKLTINEPTGRFLYDPWIIKSEFKDTVWDNILKTLPNNIGEARLISLRPTMCYQSHADIDDRYHLNLTGEYSYLINLDTKVMYELLCDGYWYFLDTSPRHTATNFGPSIRHQLVVRKLLEKFSISNSVRLKISIDKLDPDNSRFRFDDVISSWLNTAHKKKIITNFEFSKNNVIFDICKNNINEIKDITQEEFKIEVIND